MSNTIDRAALAKSGEINKIVASVLVAGITFMVTGIIGDALVHPKRLAEPAIRIEVAQAPTAAAPAAAPAIQPISGLLAEANVENGGAVARRLCSACHSFDQGGRNLVGPNLYGIIGAPHAHAAGFNYSAALAGMKDKPWDYESMNRFIARPAEYAPGTRMGFAGLANTQQRADLIAWLRTLAAEPKPLPTAEQIAAAAPPAAAPAAPAAAAPPAGPQVAAAPAAGESLGARLAAADPAAGQTVFNQLCGVCHTANEGGPARVGPNLWNIMGREHSSMPGFNYSNALKAKTGPWTYEEMYAWLANPATYAPGNRMGIGVPDPQRRANVIAYLRTLSNDPKPFPAP
jgi:cytochrome c